LKILNIPNKNTDNQRLIALINGAVQGVGFRPFVYRLANELNLTGWVCNSTMGVTIEVEGQTIRLEEFVNRLQAEKPRLSVINSFEYSFQTPVGYTDFKVKHSNQIGDKSALVLPDIATCPDCLKDISDPNNRRYQYPFTNCTNCGPRYSIIESLPYDRDNTSMKIFPMCEQCRQEYEDPANRRFHAQPNACPECGPHLELWDKQGKTLALHNDALIMACREIKYGQILAIKGLGGFHLVVDAANDQAIKRLRQLKARPKKPLALMYPNLETVKRDCELSSLEEELLTSPESPIVLLKQRSNKISSLVAPDNPYLGVMLPYTPLHHLLMTQLESPIVATSGNLADEPICIDETEALARLDNIADLFLVHNRPIVRHVDDSIVRVMMGQLTIMRRARGYAPLPINLRQPIRSILAVGAHQKNSIAISKGKQVFISQHIGDLDNRLAYETFTKTINSLGGIYDFSPEIVACDKHPDYTSTQYARDSGIGHKEIQHHFAHILSCMVENNLDGPVLGVAWDGTGYGDNGTIWGGEFLKVENNSYSRSAYLRTFRLPGGEKAIEEPWRTSTGLLYELFGYMLFDDSELQAFIPSDTKTKGLIHKMLEQNINSPITSSAGRLFDAVASLTGICQMTTFEGQAAMKLEFAAQSVKTDETYEFVIDNMNDSYILNWEPMILSILKDLKTTI
jgi:hydrogenase maturation protein HypF